MRRLRQQSGFTLVELLVTIALTSIVFAATLGVLDVFGNQSRLDQLRNETQDSARTAVDQLARQLRSVAAPSTGSEGALEQQGAYSMVFQTIDASSPPAESKNATNAMRVRYCLNDTTPTNEILWREVKRWTTATAPAIPSATACPDENAADWDSWAQLVQHVSNRVGGQARPLFVYSGASVGQTSSLEVNMYLDVNPGRRPGETQLTSGIALRNANRPPTASFTVTNVNGQVRLNASESVDPDGLALTYAWWKDGTKQESTSQVWETKETKGSHTYKLEVKDPGGLSSTAERTVVIP